jgi:hypothetical protein
VAFRDAAMNDDGEGPKALPTDRRRDLVISRC